MSTSNNFQNPFSETVTPTSDLSSSSFPTASTHNVPNLMPIKLHRDNYMLWKELFIPVLQNYDMLSILDGSAPAPPRFLPLPNLSLSTTENPAFTLWTKKDRTCKIWLHASLSGSILPYAVGCPTARDLWLTLEKRFANLTRSHVLQLKSRLQTLKKGSASMLDYLQSLKHIADSLAAAGAPLDTSDFLAHALSGLPSDYDAFATSIRVRSDPIQPEELHGLLLSEEIAVENRLTHIPPSDSHLHAFHASQSSASSAPSPHALNTSSQSSRSFPRSHSSFSSSRPNNFTP
ncbi:unnamed protein product [Prunus armeniaca]|uniref:Retrotransposon Copia-like N-terminal domain-containing protein n=1 Tax=Prunus armeniaca TaxID=36596 RepID=A0A6J5VQR2_PRUAR|nr:unnamed protein product [Prunus armeniaca]